MIKINDHIPIIFSEIAGRTLFRIEYKDVGKESEQQSLTNVLPIWILDPLTNVIISSSVLSLVFNSFYF
jgi:hypothetical protein